MKLSGYYKEFDNYVTLITNYRQLYYDENLWDDYQKACDEYAKAYKNKKTSPEIANVLATAQVKCFKKDNIKFDKIFISKVFTDTEIDEDFLHLDIVEYGGTGFFYDKAPKLPNEIEHHMPDYHLYDEWIDEILCDCIKDVETEDEKETIIKKKKKEFSYYFDYSIGFMTRGCFRQCEFCVNKNYKKVETHSSINEFLDQTRKKICLLDDNFLGSPHWKEMLLELQKTRKPFQFKQGLDERILTDERCELLFKSKYDGDYIFAFDNIADSEIIEKKLQLLRKYTTKVPKFYVFCGFDRNDKWDSEFWAQDIFDMFKRIEILMKYKCLPYIMRFNRYEESPYRGMYISIARWCNQPSFFKKKSLREFAIANGENSSCYKYVKEFENSYPGVSKYLDMKF